MNFAAPVQPPPCSEGSGAAPAAAGGLGVLGFGSRRTPPHPVRWTPSCAPHGLRAAQTGAVPLGFTSEGWMDANRHPPLLISGPLPPARAAPVGAQEVTRGSRATRGLGEVPLVPAATHHSKRLPQGHRLPENRPRLRSSLLTCCSLSKAPTHCQFTYVCPDPKVSGKVLFLQRVAYKSAFRAPESVGTVRF